MQNNNSKIDIIKFSILEFFFWSTFCIFNAFIIYYLKTKGMSMSYIGLALSASTVASVLGQYVLGYVCDLLRTAKKVFIYSLVILLALVMPFMFFKSHLIILISFTVIGFMFPTLPAILDAWILGSSRKLRDNYGIIRSVGSIGYALIAFLFGGLIDKYGWGIMFASYGVSTIITIFIAFLIKDCYEEKSINKAVDKPNPLKLFKIFDFVYFLIVSTLMYMAHNVCITLLPVLIDNVGGTPKHLGIALFVGAVSEAPILFMANFFSRFKAKTLFMVSGSVYLIRLIVLFFSTTPNQIIFASVLHSISFGLFYPAARYYINSITPNDLKATAQSTATAFFVGISGIIVSLVGGYTVDIFGVKPMILIFIGTAILSLILLVLWNPIKKSLKFQ